MSLWAGGSLPSTLPSCQLCSSVRVSFRFQFLAHIPPPCLYAAGPGAPGQGGTCDLQLVPCRYACTCRCGSLTTLCVCLPVPCVPVTDRLFRRWVEWWEADSLGAPIP